MSDTCCNCQAPDPGPSPPPGYRRVLWIALAVNLAMFAIELGSALAAGSVSLLADSIDFLGDAANYGVSLYVLSHAQIWRARTALAKGLMMGGYGLLVLLQAGRSAVAGEVPEATTMGAIGALALLANLSVATLLFAFRTGDANMRSVWLCTRNDAIGNIAVMLAALGVLGTGQAWPDLLVALGMALLGLSSARVIIVQALVEMRAGPSPPALRR
jgi:Co/Zn/Cd efflux system component